ncbi:MAG: type IV pilus modification protein PilV [Gammaproteobacteria bacterium]|nr:type IV pilus modification protein PilV [Gammaproteobacteria bacterium]
MKTMKTMPSMPPPMPPPALGARPPARHRGFSLVEVLVAITIFAIGFLALAAMQVSGLRATQISNYRSLAMFHAQTIADQMRANRVALRLANNPYYAAPPPVGGTPSADEQALLAAQTAVANAQQTVSDREAEAAERAAAQTICDDANAAYNTVNADPNADWLTQVYPARQAALQACAAPELSGPAPDVAGAQATLTTANAALQNARQTAISNGLDPNAVDSLIGALQQASATVSTCTSAVCTAEELARFEIRRWREAIGGSLPQGQGIVCIDSTPDDGDPSNWLCDDIGDVVAIKIGWLEQAAAGALQGSTLLNTERQRIVVRLAKL